MKHLCYLLLLICICCSPPVTAQNKNSLHGTIFYPFVVQTPQFFRNYAIGFNLGYEHAVSKRLSLGGDYRLTVRSNRWEGAITCGNSIGTEILDISFHDFDVQGRWLVIAVDKWSATVSMALGYSHSVFTFYGEEQTNEIRGYNLTPSIELNRKISDHFSVYAQAAYSYKHFTILRARSIDLGLGSALSF